MNPIRCHNCTHHIYNEVVEGTFGTYCSSDCLDEAEDDDNGIDDPWRDDSWNEVTHIREDDLG